MQLERGNGGEGDAEHLARTERCCWKLSYMGKVQGCKHWVNQHSRLWKGTDFICLSDDISGFMHNIKYLLGSRECLCACPVQQKSLGSMVIDGLYLCYTQQLIDANELGLRQAAKENWGKKVQQQPFSTCPGQMKGMLKSDTDGCKDVAVASQHFVCCVLSGERRLHGNRQYFFWDNLLKQTNFLPKSRAWSLGWCQAAGSIVSSPPPHSPLSIKSGLSIGNDATFSSLWRGKSSHTVIYTCILESWNHCIIKIGKDL